MAHLFTTPSARYRPPLMRAVALVSGAVVAACSQAPGTGLQATGDPLVDDCAPVTVSGFCGVVFGMTPLAAIQAFAVPLETYQGATAALPCYLMFPVGRASDLSFMVVDGVVARVDIRMRGVRTDAGIEVGSRAADVLSHHQEHASVSPDKYDPALRNIVVADPPKGRLVFQTDGRVVVEYRAGLLPAVGYVEGCG